MIGAGIEAVAGSVLMGNTVETGPQNRFQQ
jgi:hypothetical protein